MFMPKHITGRIGFLMALLPLLVTVSSCIVSTPVQKKTLLSIHTQKRMALPYTLEVEATQAPSARGWQKHLDANSERAAQEILDSFLGPRVKSLQLAKVRIHYSFTLEHPRQLVFAGKSSLTMWDASGNILYSGTSSEETPLQGPVNPNRDAYGVVFNSMLASMQSLGSEFQLVPQIKRLAALPELSLSPQYATQPVKEKYSTAQQSNRHAVGKRWALVVGISKYQDSRVPSLRYASADAQAFHDWLVSPNGGKYAPSQVKLILDSQATGHSIKSALFEWLRQALEEDMVTIFFACHGSPESPDTSENLFLLPYDIKYDSISSTGFPMWDIETALKRFIKAKKVVVIADACHSGGVGHSFDIARRANRGIKVNPISSGIQNLSNIGDGVCVISATDDKQFSQESQQWGGGHGVFTYFLLKGLEGDADYSNDSYVTLGELTSYLSEQVRRETKNAQSPTVAGRYDPALTIEK